MSNSFFDVLFDDIISAMKDFDDIFTENAIVRVRKTDYSTNFACRHCGEAAKAFIIWGDGVTHKFNSPVRVFLVCPKCGRAQVVTRDTTVEEAESDDFPFDTYECFAIDSDNNDIVRNRSSKVSKDEGVFSRFDASAVEPESPSETYTDKCYGKEGALSKRLDAITQTLALLNARLTDLESKTQSSPKAKESKTLFSSQTKADNRPAPSAYKEADAGFHGLADILEALTSGFRYKTGK